MFLKMNKSKNLITQKQSLEIEIDFFRLMEA